MHIREVTLKSASVTLEPLREAHVEPLAAVGLDSSLWEFTPGAVRSREEMADYVSAALRTRDEGSALPFVIVEAAGGRVVGSTRFGNIAPEHGRLEIGWTWIAPAWQRTRVNTEVKFLMLRHAFEVMGANRVELKTDALNQRSRRAILRIGAKEEGILREHMITASGRCRDTVYYSILRSEWNGVFSALSKKIDS
jgi:RimJ/RimL family protein N-acetyltransferase